MTSWGKIREYKLHGPTVLYNVYDIRWYIQLRLLVIYMRGNISVGFRQSQLTTTHILYYSFNKSRVTYELISDMHVINEIPTKYMFQKLNYYQWEYIQPIQKVHVLFTQNTVTIRDES